MDALLDGLRKGLELLGGTEPGLEPGLRFGFMLASGPGAVPE